MNTRLKSKSMSEANDTIRSSSPSQVKVQPERSSDRGHAGTDRSSHADPSQDGTHAVTALVNVSSLGAAAAAGDASASARASGDEGGSL